jgi:hypothetical protein
MEFVIGYFRARGYHVENTAAFKPYDVIITKGNEKMTVEVKGTTSTGEKIIVTRNEVDHARKAGNCILFIVKNIVIEQVGSDVRSHGGEPVVLWPWHVDSGSLQPISYFYSLPVDASRGATQQHESPTPASATHPQKRRGSRVQNPGSLPPG